MFSQKPRVQYHHHQLAEVICQLRFPQILRINQEEPAAFQEAIRDVFPSYKVLREVAPPKIVGAPGNFSLQQQTEGKNYEFSDAAGIWRVNLTREFISLSTRSYIGWEDFAMRLDKPLAAFISIYRPAHFDRVGLRYVNFISRKNLDLEGVPFRELITMPYLGILSDEEVSEDIASRSGVDLEIGVRGGCRAKVHAGPGRVRLGGKQDPETKFVLDLDLYMPGQLPVNLCAGALQTLHSQADSIFRDAITSRLHEAMEPKNL